MAELEFEETPPQGSRSPLRRAVLEDGMGCTLGGEGAYRACLTLATLVAHLTW